MKRGTAKVPPALRRDFWVSVLPWMVYGAGLWSGHPAWGSAAAAAVIGLLRARYVAEIKVYESILLAYFGLMVLLPMMTGECWVEGVRMMFVPAALAGAAFVSCGLGRPYTLQYSRQFAQPQWWGNPHFLRVNRGIALCWGAVFACGAVLAWLRWAHGWPGRWTVTVAGMAMFFGALRFTRIYPRWYRLNCYLPLVRSGREPYLKAPGY